jgi:hypothetical protein
MPLVVHFKRKAWPGAGVFNEFPGKRKHLPVAGGAFSAEHAAASI